MYHTSIIVLTRSDFRENLGACGLTPAATVGSLVELAPKSNLSSSVEHQKIQEHQETRCKGRNRMAHSIKSSAWI
jgi:hypothetical protein